MTMPATQLGVSAANSGAAAHVSRKGTAVAMVAGDRIKIQRDEKLYPARGTWPRWRGKTGTIAEIHLNEYGVIFTGKSYRKDGSLRGDRVWFLPHEIVPIRRWE